MKRGVIAVLISAVCFATLGIFTKLLASDISAFSVITFRLLIATAFFFFLALLIKKKIKIKKNDLKFFIPYAFIGIFISMAAYIMAFYYTSVANAIFFLFTYPVITVILAAIFLKERITKIKTVAMVLGLIGVILLFAFQKNVSLTSNDFIGCMLALITAFAFSFYLIMTRWSTRPFYTEVSWGMLLGFLFTLPLFFLFGEPSTILSLELMGWLYLIGIGLIGTAGAYVFLDYAEDYIEASTASLLGLLQAVIAVILAFLILNEVPEIHTIVGGAFIILAGILALKG